MKAWTTSATACWTTSGAAAIPSLAIIEGVDDAWEICVLKFSFEMILRSHEINAFDFKRRGLI